MRTILSAAGRASGRDALIAFLTLIGGIWMAPNLQQAGAIAGAASIGATIAGVRALRVFAPGISKAIADMLHAPLWAAEVVLTGVTTVVVGFIDLSLGVLSAPDLHGAKAAGLAGLLAIGTSLTRILQAALTPGELGAGGITVPPQPVPPAALPDTLPPH